MRALVTGGAGFIGSHLVDALLARGDQVTAFDDLSSGSRENLADAFGAGADLVEGSILDREQVDRVAAEVRPEVIFHLAAQGEVQRSIKEPAFDATANVVGTINVIEAARRCETRRVVFASTGGAIYGEGSGIDLPARESEPALPLCPYGQSKLAGETYLGLYRRMYGLDSIPLRFANVYGPRQSPKGESGAVAIFAELILQGQQPVVFGDGLQTRDFVFIDDIIEAILAASDSGHQEPLNLGSGVETSLLDLLREIHGASQKIAPELRGPATELSPDFAQPRGGEVRRISIDPSRVRETLDWSPTTGLAEGLRQTLEDIARRLGR